MPSDNALRNGPEPAKVPVRATRRVADAMPRVPTRARTPVVPDASTIGTQPGHVDPEPMHHQAVDVPIIADPYAAPESAAPSPLAAPAETPPPPAVVAAPAPTTEAPSLSESWLESTSASTSIAGFAILPPGDSPTPTAAAQASIATDLDPVEALELSASLTRAGLTTPFLPDVDASDDTPASLPAPDPDWTAQPAATPEAVEVTAEALLPVGPPTADGETHAPPHDITTDRTMADSRIAEDPADEHSPAAHELALLRAKPDPLLAESDGAFPERPPGRGDLMSHDPDDDWTPEPASPEPVLPTTLTFTSSASPTALTFGLPLPEHEVDLPALAEPAVVQPGPVLPPYADAAQDPEQTASVPAPDSDEDEYTAAAFPSEPDGPERPAAAPAPSPAEPAAPPNPALQSTPADLEPLPFGLPTPPQREKENTEPAATPTVWELLDGPAAAGFNARFSPRKDISTERWESKPAEANPSSLPPSVAALPHPHGAVPASPGTTPTHPRVVSADPPVSPRAPQRATVQPPEEQDTVWSHSTVLLAGGGIALFAVLLTVVILLS